MKKPRTKLLALLLAALLLVSLVPTALMEELPAPVEANDAAMPEEQPAPVAAIDEAVPKAEADLGGVDIADFGVEETPSYEAEWVGGEGYMSAMPAYEAADGIPIDEAHFPDQNWRSILSGGYGSNESGTGPAAFYDQNRNGILEPGEIAAITELPSIPGISDLRGLEYLTALQTLTLGSHDFPCNSLTTIAPPPQIKKLSI